MPTALRRPRQGHALLQGALLGTSLFLAVTSTVIGKAVRDALFLSHFTALQLTYADLETLGVIGIAMSLYFRVHRWLGLCGLLIASSLLFAFGDIVCWWAAAFHRPWFVRGIYYWVGTQAAITLPQVSMLAGQMLTTRQAKRVFGLIGTGAILGWIAGGLITRAAAGLVGTEALLLAMAGLTASSSMLILAIRRRGHGAAIGDRRVGPPAQDALGLLRSATLVWSSPHLRAVAMLVFLSSVVTTIAGLQFKAIASQSIPATDRLTAFLGTFSVQAGLVSLAIQILCTSRILRHFGVGLGLIVAPLALATGSVGVLIWGTLSTAVLLKASDHVFRHSIDRAALDMLYVPLSATETVQGRTFIESVVYRVGDGVGALAAAFGATACHLSFASLSVVNLVFLGAWMAVVVQARHGYAERLLLTLRAQRHDAGDRRGAQHVAAAETGRALVDRLLHPDPAIRLETLRALNASPCRSDELARAESLVTTLAAEIVGLYRLRGTSLAIQPTVAATPEYRESIERILRLLTLISPEIDPLSAWAALELGDPRLKANALEYLDSILKPEYRRLLVPLLELEP